MPKKQTYTDVSAAGTSRQHRTTGLCSGITACGVFFFLLALFRFDSSLRPSMMMGQGKQWEETVSKTSMESTGSSMCHNPNSFLQFHDSSSNNNNNINMNRIQSDVCRCAMTEWAHEAQTNTTSTIMTGLWNHPHLQRQIREAAKQSLLYCWGWMFDDNHVEQTVQGIDQYIMHTTTNNNKHLGNTTTTDNDDNDHFRSMLQNYTNLMDTMLSLLTPTRLSKSIKTKASPLVTEHILQIILKRLRDPPNNPPLKIAVFGGSVAEGYRSRANNIGWPDNMKGCNVCAWSYKLDRVLNAIIPRIQGVGGKSSSNNQTNTTQHNNDNDNNNDIHNNVPLDQIVVVKSFAVGGTDSMIGSTMLEFNLFGDMSEYDIFIASFAANDAQAPQGELRDLMLEHSQQFIRLAQKTRPCSDLPLVIQVEDVLLDGMPGLNSLTRDGLRYAREMVETNTWSNSGSVMSISYADVVRDVAYANPQEDSLIEYGELHPGLTFHTGIAWLLAYVILDHLVNACDAPTLLPEYHSAEPRVGFPMPLLTDRLLAADVPALWKQQSEQQRQQCTATTSKPGTFCVYTYMAAKLGARTAPMVQAAIAKVATHIDGWEATGNPIRKPRRTWVATKEGATFTIQLTNLEQPINRMLVLYLRSYGPQWRGTQMEVVVRGQQPGKDPGGLEWTELKRLSLSGEHNSTTSINYSEHIDLSDTFLAQAPGGNVQATFTVLSGTVFQINGLAICHSGQQ